MEDKNFILFMVLSILLIFLWMMFVQPKPKPAPPRDAAASGSTETPGSKESSKPADEQKVLTPLPGVTLAELPPVRPAAGATISPAAPEPASIIPAAVGERVFVRTDVYEVEFTSVGAAPVHWRLTNYPQEKCFPFRVEIKWPPFIKDPPCDDGFIDLVDPEFASPNYPFIAQVSVDGQMVTANTIWEIESPDLELSDGHSSGEVVFSSKLPDGRAVKKVYRFGKSRYAVELEFMVEGEKPRRAGADIALFYSWSQYSKSNVPRWNFNGPEVHDGRALQQLDPKDVVKDGYAERKAIDWAGFTTDFFLTSVLSQGSSGIDFVVKYLGTEADKKDKKKPKHMVGWVRVSGSDDDLKEGVAARVLLFAGPKDKRVLTPVRSSLRYSIDYGRLKILVLPLIEGLVWINKVFHNYGISIIILTVILRMGMFPLTRKSQKSMKQMQKLQPEIKKIREKYADDKTKQNEEMQALWRKYNINPAMGCLPMLLQFPVFFAFYKALLISIELRQAPFFGWITDLSARDPLYIWPLLMGGTQLITQKMTPTQMDPTQAKIFLAMPIVFIYILRDFPSGLLIYWTVQNLVGIAQQIYVNRQPD